MTKTLTQGNPAKLIFFFAMPLIIGNIFQQFYSMADTLIVGRTNWCKCPCSRRLYWQYYLLYSWFCQWSDFRSFYYYSPEIRLR